MKTSRLLRAAVLLLAGSSFLACGPRETPEQHLNKLRKAHDIVPTGATTVSATRRRRWEPIKAPNDWIT